MSTPADDLRRKIEYYTTMCFGQLACRNMGAQTQEQFKGGIENEEKKLIKAVTVYADARVLEALEAFRVFSYEHEALQAWDTPANNRQGWLDTKLREFAELRQQQAKGKS